MDAAWMRWLALAVIWGSPEIITLAVVGTCGWRPTARANFGAMGLTARLMALMAAGLLAGASRGVFLMRAGVGAELAEKAGGGVVLGIRVVVGLVVYLGPAVVLGAG